MAMAVEAETVAASAGERQRRGWFRKVMTATTTLRRRGHYSPVGVEPRGAAAAAEDEGAEKPRRRGWLRRLTVPGDYVDRQRQRRWKLQGGGVGGSSSSSLAAGLSRSLRRWRPGSLSGSWAAALADDVAFRVMYVVEAVVLGLALSCFFCCCGCQI
ncbi:hypothetical protein GUJ93_ZPchr0001g30407 [Zizania palustris]|uniref:Uncharacterized protein n=1 Tax=Zizania palustris TaxID=103762 RepID=A0A8J5S0K3_ZIZPA|nr:hypothetical protein GUJ93_ZPchr0001g30407 [Zizania palustris]